MSTANTSNLDPFSLGSAAYRVRIMGLRAWLERITDTNSGGSRLPLRALAREGLEVDDELAEIFGHEVSLEAQGSGQAGEEADDEPAAAPVTE